MSEKNITEQFDSEVLPVVEGHILEHTVGFMITPDNEHLYPNLTYFHELANKGNGLWSYFGGSNFFSSLHIMDDNQYEKLDFKDSPPPSTWGIDMDEIYDEHSKSNPRKILPTFHELYVIINEFNVKLFGSFICLDTRISDTKPPKKRITFSWCGEILRRKPKLPPGWHMKLNKEGTKYFYWEEKKNKAQWNHPWPTMIDDLEEKISVFKEISNNYKLCIHGYMDITADEFHKLVVRKQ